jgi:hypothetical protein
MTLTGATVKCTEMPSAWAPEVKPPPMTIFFSIVPDGHRPVMGEDEIGVRRVEVHARRPPVEGAELDGRARAVAELIDGMEPLGLEVAVPDRDVVVGDLELRARAIQPLDDLAVLGRAECAGPGRKRPLPDADIERLVAELEFQVALAAHGGDIEQL